MLNNFLEIFETPSRVVLTPEAMLIDIPGLVLQAVRAALIKAFIQSSTYTKSREIFLLTKFGYLPFVPFSINPGISLSLSSHGP